MGRLTIGTQSVTVDDRTLAHVEAVITTKLRRGEPFAFTWGIDSSMGGGRVTRWIHSAVHLDYRFDERSQMPINPGWVEALLSTANTPQGMIIVPELAARPA